MEPQLVIFDCDGVLVDSEPISIAVLRDIIGAAGVHISESAAYASFLGRSMSTVSNVLREEFDLVVTDDHLERMRSALYARFERELKPIPHIRETLLRLTMPRCVASSSQPERISLSLSITGLLELLEPHLYSATMVSKGKPAPDLFLFAAHDMGMLPEMCVVVEDSPAGIEAAKLAGMMVFGFTGGAHADAGDLVASLAALRPDALFDDMRQLPGLLASAASLRRAS